MKKKFQIPIKKLSLWADWKIQRRLKKMGQKSVVSSSNSGSKNFFQSSNFTRLVFPLIMVGGVSFWFLDDVNQGSLSIREDRAATEEGWERPPETLEHQPRFQKSLSPQPMAEPKAIAEPLLEQAEMLSPKTMDSASGADFFRAENTRLDQAPPSLLPTEQFVEDLFVQWLAETQPEGLENNTHEADQLKLKLLLEVEQDPEHRTKVGFWMTRLDQFWKEISET